MARQRGGELNGFLDAGSSIQGELHFEDTFRVDGRIAGKIVSKGDLVIGEGGEVDAEVQAGRVFVSGVLKGRVEAARIELAPGCRVHAELVTPSLVIEDGAFVQGRCSMVSPEELPETARSKGSMAKDSGTTTVS
ncbi:MAG: polymer-forming cytoskeletal protein [Thermoanaerobaculia bacterium]